MFSGRGILVSRNGWFAGLELLTGDKEIRRESFSFLLISLPPVQQPRG
jgi:hypothetical protein